MLLERFNITILLPVLNRRLSAIVCPWYRFSDFLKLYTQMKHKEIVPECQEETSLLCAPRLLDVLDEVLGHVRVDCTVGYGKKADNAACQRT